MLPNLLLGYAFYFVAMPVQAFLTDATNLSKIQMQTRVCRKMHDLWTIWSYMAFLGFCMEERSDA